MSKITNIYTTLMLRMFIVVILVFCMACNAEKQAPTETTASTQPWKLICLGGGITAGVGGLPEAAYPARLARLLMSPEQAVRVVNAGIKGETVTSANDRVEWILQQRFDALLLELGCEDERLLSDPTDVLRNWEGLLLKVRNAYPEIPIFVVNPCRGVGEMQEEYRLLAKRFGLYYPAVDLQENSGGAAWWQANTSGLTSAGQTEIAEQLARAIRSFVGTNKQ